MQPIEFISKWRAIDLSERAAAHSHFIDLCSLLGEDNPTDADPTGERYCFERGAVKTTGRPGWADVWKRDCFGWEYKKKRRNLTEAFVQLQQYAIALENPPLLVVSDIDRIEVHTNWTNSVGKVYEYALDDLRDAKVRDLLKCVWADPEKLRPGKTRAELTEEAAAEFAMLAQRLRQRGHGAETVAHFINRLVFCMFAEDAGLLPNQMFKRMLGEARRKPSEFIVMGADLFRAMKAGGRVGFEHVDWFNGGLFDDDTAIPLDADDLALMQHAASLNWSEIDTTIFGTLFERGLDPDKRSQLGAHYTDRDKIRLIVEPVITRPFLAEWGRIKATLAVMTGNTKPSRRGGEQPNLAAAAYHSFIARLRAFRVLDPACGSGNFLYVALLALKDIEHQVAIEAEALGLEREFPHIGPESVLGIEVNPYAAELARITVWIGEIQWMRRNGFNVSRDPILKPLETIERRDAVLTADGAEATWPEAHAVIGNPPFLGDKRMRGALGNEQTEALRAAYAGRVPGNADLVTYWFEKARAQIAAGVTKRVGLVATNVISRGANRGVLDRIIETTRIFDVWSDQEWVNEGAAVRVSLICFGDVTEIRLDGKSVSDIASNLTARGSATALTGAEVRPLAENAGCSFFGLCLAGNFKISEEMAVRWLAAPNPNGRPNSDVLRPIYNGSDITARWSRHWVIDFGAEMGEAEATLYQLPFEYVLEHVKPVRDRNNRAARAANWWRHGEARPGLRRKLTGLSRYIATPETAKHRFFVWFPMTIAPEHSLIVIPRDDDVTFGILQSKFHEHWTMVFGSPYGNHPTARRYNASRTFETFPFPEGLVPNRSAEFYAADPRAVSIAAAAKRLDDQRNNWLSSPNDTTAEVLKAHMLTNLYNEQPTWLRNAHRDLDEVVAAAYGWPVDISEEDAHEALLNLNQARAAQEPPKGRRVAPERLRREPSFPLPLSGGILPEQPSPEIGAPARPARPARRRRAS